MFFDNIFVTNPLLRRVWRAGFQIEEPTDKNGETAENTRLPQICNFLEAGFSSDAVVPRGRLSLRTSGVLISGAASIHRQEAERCISDLSDLDKALVLRNRRSSFGNDSLEPVFADTPEMIMKDNRVVGTSSPIFMPTLGKKSLKRMGANSEDHAQSLKRPTTVRQLEIPSPESNSAVEELPQSPTFTENFNFEANLNIHKVPSPENPDVDRDAGSALRVVQVETENTINSIISSAARFSEQIKSITTKIINAASIYFEGNRSTASNILLSAANYSNAIRNLTNEIVNTAAVYSAKNMKLTTEITAPGYSKEIRNITNDVVTSAAKYFEEIENIANDVVNAAAKNFDRIDCGLFTTKTVTSAAKYAKEIGNITTKIVTCSAKHSKAIRLVTDVDDGLDMGSRNAETQTIERCEDIAVCIENVSVARNLVETDKRGDEVDQSQKSPILGASKKIETSRTLTKKKIQEKTDVKDHGEFELAVTRRSVEVNTQSAVDRKRIDTAKQKHGQDLSGKSHNREGVGSKARKGTERYRRKKLASKKSTQRSGQAPQSVPLHRNMSDRSSNNIDETLPFANIYLYHSFQLRFPYNIVFTSPESRY